LEEQKEKLGALPYVIGGLAFIPLAGLLFGGIAIVWGLVTGKRGGLKLALIGGSGIAVTVALWGALFYFGFLQRGGLYDKLRGNLAQATLASLVEAIETYKVQHGSYPQDLGELRQSLPQEALVYIVDPTDTDLKDGQRYYFYELVDPDHYYARSVGPDGAPFTADDIVPSVAGGSIGLLTEAPRETSGAPPQ
jgi:hypothetical protein